MKKIRQKKINEKNKTEKNKTDILDIFFHQTKENRTLHTKGSNQRKYKNCNKSAENSIILHKNSFYEAPLVITLVNNDSLTHVIGTM